MLSYLQIVRAISMAPCLLEGKGSPSSSRKLVHDKCGRWQQCICDLLDSTQPETINRDVFYLRNDHGPDFVQRIWRGYLLSG